MLPHMFKSVYLSKHKKKKKKKKKPSMMQII